MIILLGDFNANSASQTVKAFVSFGALGEAQSVDDFHGFFPASQWSNSFSISNEAPLRGTSEEPGPCAIRLGTEDSGGELHITFNISLARHDAYCFNR